MSSAEHRPAARSQSDTARVAGCLVLAAVAAAILTVRFPPADLMGWVASATSLPIWAVCFLSAAIAAAGLLLVKPVPGRTGTLTRFTSATVALIAAAAGVAATIS